MSGKLFIHIGLPKTATTTLQTEFFPRLSCNGVDYVGVYQPRSERHQRSLYRDFLAAAYTGSNIKAVRNEIASKLFMGVSLLISDEMLTVSDGEFTWHGKLKNLGALVSGLDYHVILTVREPASALFSYYVETYPRVAKRFLNFESCALNDESMHIYHYKKLTDVIFSYFEPRRVHAFKFEDIIKNNLSALAALISQKGGCDCLINLENHNKRPQVQGYVNTHHAITALDVLRNVVTKLGMIKRRPFSWINIPDDPVAKHLNSVVLKNIKVMLPPPEEFKRLRSLLHEETVTLDNYFGIKYK